MDRKILLLALILSLSFTSCKGEKQRQKEQLVANSISEMKAEANSGQEQADSIKTGEQTIGEQIKSKILGTSPGDSIIGIWEVNNDYYMAIYEILKYEHQYVGKMHYYNDGETELEAKGSEDDYFLDGITFKEGKYSNGNMYMPDGKQYIAKFTIKGDILNVEMTIDGYPYTEVWKRKIYEKKK